MRISTTVDRDVLEQARQLVPGPDSELVQQALVLLVDARLGEIERAALALHPYEDDPDLNWSVPFAPLPPYDGPIPDDVIELARARRRERGEE